MTRAAMMEQTRLKLLQHGRVLFGTVGFADTVMDQLTGQAGLTRGALYHHFGSKKGLFLAVYQQLDQEMDSRLQAISASAPDSWSAFSGRCHAYLKMVTEPDIQRIMIRDASSVLDSEQIQAVRMSCIEAIAGLLTQLLEDKIIPDTSPVMLARLINGALLDTARYIAGSEDSVMALNEAEQSLDLMLNGLRR